MVLTGFKKKMFGGKIKPEKKKQKQKETLRKLELHKHF